MPRAEQQPPLLAEASGEVSTWLARHGIQRYSADMCSKGYDQLVFFQGMEAEEVEDLIKQLGMLRPHANALKRGLLELNGGAATGAQATVVGGILSGPTTPVVMGQPHTAATAAVAVAVPAAHAPILCGHPAWLRVPNGPWMNKWVQCDVLAGNERTGWNVKPHGDYVVACSGWMKDNLGQGWNNRRCPADVQANLEAGMQACGQCRRFRTADEITCPQVRWVVYISPPLVTP